MGTGGGGAREESNKPEWNKQSHYLASYLARRPRHSTKREQALLHDAPSVS